MGEDVKAKERKLDAKGPAEDEAATDLAAKPTEPLANAPGVDTNASAAVDEEASDSIFSEFLLFLKEEKKWWLAPLVIVLLLLSVVIIFAEGSAIAPFIYTIF
jgi:hypothetical protein